MSLNNGAPQPVNTGTGLFIAAAAVVIIWAWALSKGGYLSRDSLQIITVVVITLIIETWLLWLCCWMHQWHPLIYPEWHNESEE